MPHAKHDLIEVGHILGPHGVRGQMKVYSHTSPRENIVNYSPWVVDQAGQQQSYEVSGCRQGKHVIAQLKGINDRDPVIEMNGAKILIDRSQLPVLQSGDYYWSQLIGLNVKTQDGMELGQIDQMMETGANDVMVVQGDRERLIPFVLDEVVKAIDLEHQQILVDWDAEF